MKKLLLATAILMITAVGASASPRQHHVVEHRHYQHHAVIRHYRVPRAIPANEPTFPTHHTPKFTPWHQDATHIHFANNARPKAWCGWFMRKLLGVANPAFNLARNWAHWGHAGPAGVGAVVVWPHHVGKIVGREGGEWVIQSGNDGHAVRTRPRSIAGAIAVRRG